jgi:alpha-ketoglutaric semialdehyde dehydrogenase
MSERQWFGGQYLGAERSRAGRTTFQAIDPRSGEELPGTFADATGEEVTRACELAAQAFERVTDIAPAGTSDLIARVADGLEQASDQIVTRADAETALGRPRLEGELARTTGQLRMFVELVRQRSWLDIRIDAKAGPDLRRMRIPLGPVAVFGASNFPLAFSVPGGDTASAWAAGCPVVVKAHPAHPGTSELVAEVIQQALAQTDLPAAYFQMVQGTGHDVGQALVANPNIRAVGFTGSFTGGMALARAAAERDEPIPVFSEMSSVNPVFLLPTALKEQGDSLSEALFGSVTLGVGQFCTSPGLLFAVASDALDSCLSGLAGRMNQEAGKPMLTRAICEAYQKGLSGFGNSEGMDRLTEARTVDGMALPALFSTTASTFLSRPSLAEENFGPSTLAVICRDADELQQVASKIPGSLTTSIYAAEGDSLLARRLLPRLARRSGRIIFNGMPTGVAVSPAMHHGGPFPATTDSRFTSVGTAAVERFTRPICFQDVPVEFLPNVLRNGGNREGN